MNEEQENRRLSAPVMASQLVITLLCYSYGRHLPPNQVFLFLYACRT